MRLYGLKSVRTIYGFTMRELAKRINVSANAINLWENGDIDVPESRVDNLAYYLQIDKSLLGKEKHDNKDLMLIEIARANFKINEYRALVKKDTGSINSTIVDVLDSISDLTFNVNETEFEYNAVKTLIEKIIKMYSFLDNDEYDEFDDILREIIDNILNDRGEFIKFKTLYYSLSESEDMELWEEDYGLFCSVEDLLEKQIRDNVDMLLSNKEYVVENVLESQIRENAEQLCKRKLYESGKYKPYWEEE